MFGVETEYALTGMVTGQNDADCASLPRELMRLAKTELRCIAGMGGGDLYLENGSRLYVDYGGHPELATPECVNPWDVVRYIQAGDQMLGDLCRRIAGRGERVGEVFLFRCNVDYSGARSTWGSHESYLHAAEPTALPQQLIPHLVSRIVYTGAGGFNPLAPGLEFTLSPRVHHLTRSVSESSTANRGIFHTKDESLCGAGYHRLHILCGESLCSEIAAWLRVGTTALVVAMIEAGLNPGVGVEPTDPLDALRCFAADPALRAEVPVEGGRRLSALAIQRHYLELAMSQLGQGFMPPWAPAVCLAWNEILEALEADPQSQCRTLDWAIKHELYLNRSRRRGIDPSTWPFWSGVVGALNAALGKTEYRGKSVRVEFVLAPESPIRDTVERLTPSLHAHGLRWEDLRSFMDLQQELFEIDLRFGQVGDGGLFAVLNRQGLLVHHIEGVDNIEHARREPPADGRARLRGMIVRRLAGQPEVLCSWEGIWNQTAGMYLDLADPFEHEEHWRKTPVRERSSLGDLVREL
jgi:hypothetical protein